MKFPTASFYLSAPPFMKSFVNTLKTPFAVLLQTDYGSTKSSSSNFLSKIKETVEFNFQRFKKINKNSPRFLIIAGVILVVIIGFIFIKAITGGGSSSGFRSDSRVEINKPLFQQKIDKTFNFPLKDASGKEVSKLRWTVQDVELRDEIIVKGQRARSVKGRVFLIVNIKITNSYDKSIAVNSRDYLRVIINNSSEKLAAEIHNDPVDVQAISTKYTRLGLPINEADKNIVLQIGEIEGKKENIKLNL